MLTLLSAITLGAGQAAAAPPPLTPPQAEALRCGVAFALVSRMQGAGGKGAPGWPAMGARGREYFVRVTARLMEDTGASRDTIAALASREVPALQAAGALDAARPGCLPLLDASGL